MAKVKIIKLKVKKNSAEMLESEESQTVDYNLCEPDAENHIHYLHITAETHAQKSVDSLSLKCQTKTTVSKQKSV